MRRWPVFAPLPRVRARHADYGTDIRFLDERAAYKDCNADRDLGNFLVLGKLAISLERPQESDRDNLVPAGTATFHRRRASNRMNSQPRPLPRLGVLSGLDGADVPMIESRRRSAGETAMKLIAD